MAKRNNKPKQQLNELGKTNNTEFGAELTSKKARKKAARERKNNS